MNNSSVSEANSQKQLGTFEEHLKMILDKVIKTTGLLNNLHNILPRSALFTIYKGFVRPDLDYGNIICDQTYNAIFHQKFELIQYKAC